LVVGHPARGNGQNKLHSYQVGALPIINHILDRMGLREILTEHLPPDDPRTRLPTARALLVLLRNVLVSREPMYGVSQWAAKHAPDLLDLWPHELEQLNDDRLGRALSRLFDGTGPVLVLGVVRHVVREFEVSLDELHNDSTSISFYGAYRGAAEEGNRRGKATHAITWGFSKDHRPDLKQLLYILTISDDGGIPVSFRSASGNTVDDQTHRQTWNLLRQLVGGSDFLYVADCKLATRKNMNYIAQRGGRFVTVLPATRKECRTFRQRLREEADAIHWSALYEVTDDEDEVVDQLSVCSDELVTAEGYRLLWYYSTRKKELDELARGNRLQRAMAKLARLRQRLQGPRTRFRQRAKVEAEVQKILPHFHVGNCLVVEIQEHQKSIYRQARRGRPGKDTPYRKQVVLRYDLSWQINGQGLLEEQLTDGVFPLVSNSLEMTAEQLLRAYKRQPVIEKRFSQLKTDFAVAPVYLQEVSRIQGLLSLYFLVLMVQTLLERELRKAMAKAKVESLPLYPEGRPCTRPTTRLVFDLFEPIQRHHLTLPDGSEEIFVTQLTPLQRQILTLLGIDPNSYGL
jgi:transposase